MRWPRLALILLVFTTVSLGGSAAPIGSRGISPIEPAAYVSASSKIALATSAATTTSAQRRLAPVPAEWRSARASWYGPGFYGRRTANGTVLTKDMMNVAHRTLPFGTRIEFEFGGRRAIAVVNDRGPFISGRVFDLGPGTARALGFGGVQTVRYRILERR